MKPLTVLGYASGSPLSHIVMSKIAREHRLLAVVTPQHALGLRAYLGRVLRRRQNPLSGLGAPLIQEADATRYAPDLIVVASFPRILRSASLARARLGALNIHMSLLPRHRGIDPIFWTYWDDDTQAGVTIHWMDQSVDGGDIAAQHAVPLERGRPSRELYLSLANCAADLLSCILAKVAAGKPPRRPQSGEGASHETAADIRRARIPLSQWPSERVWHVLKGLGDQRTGLVEDAYSKPLPHGRATSFHLSPDVTPGRAVASPSGYDLHCSDGIVSVLRRS